MGGAPSAIRRATCSRSVSPQKTVPYLGILHNEGDFRGLYNIFLEPCTCGFDRPDVARLHGQTSTIPARGAYEWQMAVRLGEGEIASTVYPL